MNKIITQGKIPFLALPISKDYTDFKIFCDPHLRINFLGHWNERFDAYLCDYNIENKSEIEILSKYSELTEEDCQRIVTGYGVDMWHNYYVEPQYEEYLLKTAKESLKTLLIHNECIIEDFVYDRKIDMTDSEYNEYMKVAREEVLIILIK